MSNKKRIRKKQKSITSYRDAKVWECIAIALKAVNNAIDLQREKLRATQLSKNNFPRGGFISSFPNDVERILDSSGGWKPVPIVHPRWKAVVLPDWNKTMAKEELIAESWKEYFKKNNEVKPSFLNYLQDAIKRNS